MFDANLMLRASSEGDLDASETSKTWVNFGAADVRDFTYWIVVPAAGGTSPTLDVKIQTSDDGSTVQDEVVVPQITAARIYKVSLRSPHPYRRVHLTLGGTTPNFGAVQIGPRLAGEHTSF